MYVTSISHLRTFVNTFLLRLWHFIIYKLPGIW
nr:MAG TPA: hypothetical protein [Caudoviricetes sp.]